MSFLDEVPQDWSKPELPALRDLCVLAFHTIGDAQRLAARSRIVPGTFPVEHNLRAIWTDLIQVLGHQGNLRMLVEHAALEPGAAAFHGQFRQLLREHPEVPISAAPSRSVVPDWHGGEESGSRHLQRLMERRSRLLDLELASGLLAAASSVARLKLRFGAERGLATAFLIAPDALLTNHHNVVHPEHGTVTNAVAEFDHDRTPRQHRLVSRLDVDSISGDAVADWAAVRLHDPVDRPALRLGSPFNAGIDDLVVIIQHPAGAYKQFALQPLAVQHVDDEYIQYVADTQDGSSGSPVFNEDMHVIALHSSETPVDVMIGGTSQTVWRNQGVNIRVVMRGLRAHDIPFSTNKGVPDA